MIEAGRAVDPSDYSDATWAPNARSLHGSIIVDMLTSVQLGAAKRGATSNGWPV